MAVFDFPKVIDLAIDFVGTTDRKPTPTLTIHYWEKYKKSVIVVPIIQRHSESA